MMKNVVVYGDGIIGKLTAIALSDYFNVYIISSSESKTANNNQDRYFSINLLSKFMFIKYGLWEDIHKNISKGYNKIVTWHESLNEDVIFNSRLIATPIIGIIGIIAAPAILAANASLDLKDRLTASELSKACGGKGIAPQEIAGDVAVNGSLGLIFQGTNFSIYPGGNEVPVSTAAEAATN